MVLQDLLRDDSASMADVSAHLDSLSHGERMDQVLACGGKLQRSLFAMASASQAITLEHFVPAGIDPLAEVIHHGRNTLPAFRRFQKRFCRAADREDELYGYNEGLTRPLIGPGFFVAHSTAGNDAWERQGAIVVNYFRVPEGAVVESWPKVVPNSRGLQTFVYKNTRDFMRKVSSHVAIGSAFKKDKPMNAFFVLVREDPA